MTLSCHNLPSPSRPTQPATRSNGPNGGAGSGAISRLVRKHTDSGSEGLLKERHLGPTRQMAGANHNGLAEKFSCQDRHNYHRTEDLSCGQSSRSVIDICRANASSNCRAKARRCSGTSSRLTSSISWLIRLETLPAPSDGSLSSSKVSPKAAVRLTSWNGANAAPVHL